jgi:carboxymethylenebutenolidase
MKSVKYVAGVALVAAMLISGASRISGKARTETVQFKSGDETISGFLALPSSAGRHPGIVAIHEWWGLNDWVKEQAVKLSDQGYVVLAVDLYRGKVATEPDEAHELMRGLPPDRALRDMEAAFHYLGDRKDVTPNKIGSIGWCMGGGLSIQLAIHEPHLAACVVNYGSLPVEPAQIQSISAPILGNFGSQDRGITPADVRGFEASAKSAGKHVDMKVYAGAGHGFENPVNKTSYNADAAADAWSRIVAFFAKTLK